MGILTADFSSPHSAPEGEASINNLRTIASRRRQGSDSHEEVDIDHGHNGAIPRGF